MNQTVMTLAQGDDVVLCVVGWVMINVMNLYWTKALIRVFQIAI